MTALSAWRPLKDAPAEGTILVKLVDGQLKLATATVVTVGFCHHGGDPGWQEAAWVDEAGQVTPDDSIVGWLPIANTYELDRAVQKAIAEAFGELIGRLADEADCANFRHWGALAAFRDILHTSMGGRIPDEVP